MRFLRNRFRRLPGAAAVWHHGRFRAMELGLLDKFGDYHVGKFDEDARFEALYPQDMVWLHETVGPVQGELASWPTNRFHNGWFDAGDAETYYAVVRTYKPNRIIEIGSGWSTWFALRALKANGRGSITSIDPLPRRRIGARVSHIRERVEDVPIDTFSDLERGDVLFIDSSHSAEEALHHLKLLDVLQPGVLIHHHDFVYPYGGRLPEEEVILPYYARQRSRFHVRAALAYHYAHERDAMLALFPNIGWNGRTPLSLWAERITS